MEFKETKGKWWMINHIVTSEKGQDIAEVFDSLDEENMANCQLISKAPEMLNMLQDILEAQDNGETYHSYKIEQLIKEATEI